MIIKLTANSKERLASSQADLASILVDHTVTVTKESRFTGYDMLGQEVWEIELEVVRNVTM